MDFQGGKITLKDTIIMDTCHHTFVQICRRYNVRVSLNVNYRLGLIIMCQYMSIDSNKFTTLVGDADNGTGYAYSGRSLLGPQCPPLRSGS